MSVLAITSDTLQIIAYVLSGLFVFVIAAAVAWPVLRSRATLATLDLLKLEVAAEREARLAGEERCAGRLLDQQEKAARDQAQCVKEIGELRGQVQALTTPFAQEIAATVAIQVSKMLSEGTAGKQ